MTERVRRFISNAAVLGAAAFLAALAETDGALTVPVIAAAATVGAFAAFAALAKISGFVTPGNPIVVNALFLGVAAGFSSLAAGGELSKAALVLAAGAAVRGAAGVSFSVSDHPQPE